MANRPAAKALRVNALISRGILETRPEAPQPVAQLLHRAMQLADSLFSASQPMQEIGLTTRQHAVLSAIARHEGGSQAQITEATGIDRSTLSDIVRRLIRRGWVTRRKTREDARAYNIRLSPEGQAVLAKAESCIAGTDKQLLAFLPPHLREPFVTGLTALAHRPRPN